MQARRPYPVYANFTIPKWLALRTTDGGGEIAGGWQLWLALRLQRRGLSEGRNTIIGPGLVNIDLALDRNFQLADRFQPQFRGELFNILNHTNFNLPSTTYDSATFGSLTSATDPREVQFGLKLIF